MKQQPDARFFFLVVVLAVLSYHSTLAWQSVAPQIQRYHHQRRQPSILQSPLRPRFVRTTTTTSTIPLKDAAAHFPGNTNNSGEESLERGNPKAAADGSPYFAKNPNSSLSSSSSSLLRKIDDWGLGLKPKAVHANAKASLADTNKEQYWYTAKSCGLWALFIIYRAYRGFFVLAPAVFRATFQKLESVIDAAPFDDHYYSTTTTSMSSRDVRPNSNQQTPSWRTRFTISALAAVVTMSYLLGGALRVMRHLIQSTWNGRNVPQSLQAAATEQERNEAKLWRLATRPNNKDTSNTNVNGQSDRLAP